MLWKYTVHSFDKTARLRTGQGGDTDVPRIPRLARVGKLSTEFRSADLITETEASFSCTAGVRNIPFIPSQDVSL
ncbi:hypothetical protein J6590_044276 [Homalodisca vitripennis]|nr:hypothetical protein J6590_044276 [Homalodisca vitripennis]